VGEEDFYVRFLEADQDTAEEWSAALKLSEEGVGGWQLLADHEPTVDQKRRAAVQTTVAIEPPIAPLAIAPREEKTQSVVEKMKDLLVASMPELMKHENFILVESIARCLAKLKAETDCGGVGTTR
jgi:hypothetical protein